MDSIGLRQGIIKKISNLEEQIESANTIFFFSKQFSEVI